MVSARAKGGAQGGGGKSRPRGGHEWSWEGEGGTLWADWEIAEIRFGVCFFLEVVMILKKILMADNADNDDNNDNDDTDDNDDNDDTDDGELGC